MKKYLGVLCLAFLSFKGANAFESNAKQAIVMDAHTGAVVYEKNAHQVTAPSSMTKIMTAYVIFDLLKRKELKFEDRFEVSKKARYMTGSRMFLEIRTKPSVDELLYGILVQSGNDACVTIAEGVYGSEEAAVDAMNAKVKAFGMTKTHFENVTGMPNDKHNSTVYDIALASRRVIDDFPEYSRYFTRKDYMHNKIRQPNSNPFLALTGGDCCKTGFTDRGGYGVAGSVKRGNTRFIIVINGLDTMRERRAEAARITEWAFRNYKTAAVAVPGQVVDMADVWLGAKPLVPLTVREPLIMTIPKRTAVKATLEYMSPLQAPVRAGQKVGIIRAKMSSGEIAERDVYVAEDIADLQGLEKIKTAFRTILYGRDAFAAKVEANKFS